MMRTGNVVLTEARELAKLKALQEAARVGFADLEEDRYTEFESVDDRTVRANRCTAATTMK
jgi:hypothetical protein